MALFRTDSLGSPLLPTSWDGSSRSFGRRVSYSLKSRANRYALRITIALTLAVLVFLYATTRGQSGDAISVYETLTNNGKLHLYTRDKHGDAQQHMEEEEVDLNGLSLLLDDLEAEDELLSEDALWITSYDESKILAEETEEERLRNEQHMMDIKKHDSEYALSSIAWFLSEGGILPHDFVVPSKETISRIGGRGFERMLNKLDLGENGESIFQDGWADYARKQYRVIVFSKSYCPFSKRAKRILERYRLTPSPFIVELDLRSDMDKLQTLLLRLTGRRTVPNIFLDFQSVGGSDELQMADGEGVLNRRFAEMGIIPGHHRRFVPKAAEPALPGYELGRIDIDKIPPVNKPVGQNPMQVAPPQAQLPRPAPPVPPVARPFDPAKMLGNNDDNWAPAPQIVPGKGDRIPMHEQMNALKNKEELDTLRDKLSNLQELTGASRDRPDFDFEKGSANSDQSVKGPSKDDKSNKVENKAGTPARQGKRKGRVIG